MNKVIWAMGGRHSKNFAHVYLSEEDYKNGFCLCGRRVTPYLLFSDWNLKNEDMKEHTCPSCYERLNLLKLIHNKNENDTRTS